MPNDCENHVTIYADPNVIKLLKDTGLRLIDLIKKISLPENLRTYHYTFHKSGQGAIRFTLTSAWRPAHSLFEALMNELPISFIKNDWYVEDGAAGVWIAESVKGAPPSIRQLEWNEGCMEEIHYRFEE